MSALSCRFKPQNSITSTAWHALLLCGVYVLFVLLLPTLAPRPPFQGGHSPCATSTAVVAAWLRFKKLTSARKINASVTFAIKCCQSVSLLPHSSQPLPLHSYSSSSSTGWHCPLSCNNCRHLAVVLGLLICSRSLVPLLLLHVKCSTMSNSDSDWAGQVTFTY